MRIENKSSFDVRVIWVSGDSRDGHQQVVEKGKTLHASHPFPWMTVEVHIEGRWTKAGDWDVAASDLLSVLVKDIPDGVQVVKGPYTWTFQKKWDFSF